MKHENQDVCPNCGYCPHCKRGGHQLSPVYPAYPWWQVPTPYPTWIGPTWWAGSPNIGTGGITGTTTTGIVSNITGDVSTQLGSNISFTN